MKEPTEREKKLISAILFLISTLNVYTMAVGYVYETFRWFEHMLEKNNVNESQEELIKYLKDEFDISLEAMKDKDIIQKRDELVE
jgi:hypothetical protein